MTCKEVMRQIAEKNANAQQRCADYQTAMQAVQRSFEGSTSRPPPEQKLIQQTLRLESVLRSQKAKAATHSQWYSEALDIKQQQIRDCEAALRNLTSRTTQLEAVLTAKKVKVGELQEVAAFYLDEVKTQLAGQVEHARLVEKVWGNSVHNVDNYLVRGFTTLEPVGDMPREQLDIPRLRPVLTHAHHGSGYMLKVLEDVIAVGSEGPVLTGRALEEVVHDLIPALRSYPAQPGNDMQHQQHDAPEEDEMMMLDDDDDDDDAEDDNLNDVGMMDDQDA